MRFFQPENVVCSARFSLMLFYSSSGILMPFLPAWIAANGYNVQEVAYIMSACMFSRAFMTLLTGNVIVYVYQYRGLDKNNLVHHRTGFYSRAFPPA